MPQDFVVDSDAAVPVVTGIVADRPTTMAALAEVLSSYEEISVIGTATLGGAQALLQDPTLQILIVNLSLSAGDGVAPGVAFIRMAKRQRPDVGIISLKRTVDERQLRAALDAGANACCLVLTAAARLRKAIKVVNDGATWLDAEVARAIFHPEMNATAEQRNLPHLSPRQRQILGLLVEGYTNQEIAEQLGCATPTVRTHLTALYRSIGVDDRVSAAVYGLRHGLA